MAALPIALSFINTGEKFLMGLLAAHDKRVAEAKAENSAVNAALAALVHDVQVIVEGYNNGTIVTGGAVQACINVDNWYWQYVNPYTQYKNANPAQCNPNQFGDSPGIAASGVRCWQSTQRGSHFTAASDIGCNIIDATLGTLRAAILSLNGKAPGTAAKVTICDWPNNKYGLVAGGGQEYTLVVPKAVNPQEVTLSATGDLEVGKPPSATDTVVQNVPTSSTRAALNSLGLSNLNISPNFLLVGLFAIVALILLTGRAR